MERELRLEVASSNYELYAVDSAKHWKRFLKGWITEFLKNCGEPEEVFEYIKTQGDL